MEEWTNTVRHTLEQRNLGIPEENCQDKSRQSDEEHARIGDENDELKSAHSLPHASAVGCLLVLLASYLTYRRRVAVR